MLDGECNDDKVDTVKSKIAVSEQRGEADTALHAEKEWAYITLNSICDAVLTTDTQSRVTYLNKMAEELTGWTRAEAFGNPLERVLPLVDNQTHASALNPAGRAMAENRPIELSLDAVLTRRDGSQLEIEDSAAPVHNRHGEVVGAVVIFHDACQSLTRSARFAYQAQHDPLTGLPNRFLFAERLSCAMSQARRRQQPLALLYLDIDHFKAINDTFGHALGDRYLQVVAERLKACLRTTDTICRQGGDEFVVLLTEIIDASSALGVADKILAALANPCQLEGHEHAISVSIGVSLYPDHAQSESELLHLADMAMYAVKQSGRHQCLLYHADMQQAASNFLQEVEGVKRRS
ncbi:diguanylate cyclase domain-containing protein [Vreelandella sp. GE22]